MEDSIDYGALFGIDIAGGKGQEIADPAPAETTQAQGEEEQEAADPAGEEKKEENDAGLEAKQTGGETEKRTEGKEEINTGRKNSETGKEQEPEQSKQTAAQNAAFAAARRKAESERDAAIRKAKEEAQAEAQRTIDEAFKNSGLTNPYTKKPITTKAEYDEYKARFEAERKASILKKSGMSDAEFSAFVASLPEVREAKQAQAQAEKAQREANEAQAKAQVDEQLKEIGKLNPSIRELKDLAGMETYPKFYELVKKGNTLVDAYRLANFEALTQGTAAEARQAAINNLQGKQHMGQTQARGTGAVSVPAEVKEMYRMLNPGATDAEIQAHYNRSRKNG